MKMRKETQIIKRIMAIILSISLVLNFEYMNVDAADDTYTVSVNVTYGQTEARTMLDMINAFRTGSEAWYWNSDDTTKTTCTGLSTLTYSYDLEQIAMQRAVEVAMSFAHTRPDGTSCFTCTYNGTSSSGENIAIGYSTAESVFTGWREDDKSYSGQGHRRNMLSSRFQTVGIGHAVVNGVHCWVQEFGTGSAAGTVTSALDGKKDMTVDVLAANITETTVTPSKTICSAVIGETTDVPVLAMAIKLSGTWSYLGAIEVSVPYTWKSDNESIVTVSGGILSAQAAGNTTISTTVLGQNVTVDFHALETVETEHAYDEGVITKAPTCLVKGIKTFTCTGCGDTYTEEVAALGHDFSSPLVVSTPATCTTAGQGGRDCIRKCGWYMPQTIPATGHTVVTDAAVAATCTKTGLTAGSHCSVCDAVIVEQKMIPATGHHFVEVVEPATPEESGWYYEECSDCGEVSEGQIEIPMINQITLAKDTFTYNGKTQKPKVTVVDETGEKILPANYVVTYQSGCKNVGAYKVMVTFTGERYSGVLTSTFTIIPKGTSVTKLTGKKKSISATWKKQTNEITGYQIQYSTRSDFKGTKTVTVKSAKTIKKSLTKLSAKKKYYVRVRTYKTVLVGGKSKKLYSEWSKVKYVKTK